MTTRVFLVSLTIEIPVVADSEEEARDFLLEEDCDVLEQSMAQVKASMIENESGEDDLACEEITEESLEEAHAHHEDSVPWGDDRDETVGQRVREEPSEPSEDVEQPGWGEPSHEDD